MVFNKLQYIQKYAHFFKHTSSLDYITPVPPEGVAIWEQYC